MPSKGNPLLRNLTPKPQTYTTNPSLQPKRKPTHPHRTPTPTSFTDWSEIMSAFMKVLPSPGLKLATICGCGSGANENAFKLAFIHKAAQARAAKGLKPIEVADEDKLSCMTNNLPGSLFKNLNV